MDHVFFFFFLSLYDYIYRVKRSQKNVRCNLGF